MTFEDEEKHADFGPGFYAFLGSPDQMGSIEAVKVRAYWPRWDLIKHTKVNLKASRWDLLGNRYAASLALDRAPKGFGTYCIPFILAKKEAYVIRQRVPPFVAAKQVIHLDHVERTCKYHRQRNQ